MDKQPPSVTDRAPGAQEDGSSVQEEPSGPFELGPSDRDRRVPEVRVDRDRIEARAPRRELSPAQALDLVRRASRGDRDGSGDTP